MLYQLSYTPRLRPDCIAAARHDPAMGRYAMPTLFTVLTAAFVAIAFAAASHKQWVIAVAAAALAVWMGQFALSALRKRRR